MWRLDMHGTPLDNADAAREELRRRAWLAVSDGLRCGRDVRHHRVRVRDEAGTIVFEGTLAEAIASEELSLLPLDTRHKETVADVSRRLRTEAAMNRQTLTGAVAKLSATMARLEQELRTSERLVEMSRSYSSSA